MCQETSLSITTGAIARASRAWGSPSDSILVLGFGERKDSKTLAEQGTLLRPAESFRQRRPHNNVVSVGESVTRETHPVWTVYDRLRTARLNVKYYSRRLERLERQNFWIELVLMATAPSSSIAGFLFWKTEYGNLAWKCLGVIAAVAAILKPLLGLAKRIKELESVLTGYRTLEFDLMEIKSLVEQKQKYDGALQSELKKALQREKVLVGRTPETRENVNVKLKCELEVLEELPRETFYIPEE